MVSSRFRTVAGPYLDYLARPIVRLGLTPNTVTFLGLGFSIIASLMYATHNLIFAFIALILASVADVADGAVAKLTQKQTSLGGFLDSVTDRYSDAIILLGIGVFLRDYYLLIFVALAGTLLVSYTRARAEMEIEKCDVGVGERAERLFIILIATFIEATNIVDIEAFYWALLILVVLTHLTAVQRVWFTYKTLKG